MSEPWTFARNKLFEQALAMYDQDRPDYWQNVARAAGGGITAEEAIRHFERLNRDVNHIETDGDSGSGNSSRGSRSRQAHRRGRL